MPPDIEPGSKFWDRFDMTEPHSSKSLWPDTVIEDSMRLREIFKVHGLSAEWARVMPILLPRTESEANGLE